MKPLFCSLLLLASVPLLSAAEPAPQEAAAVKTEWVLFDGKSLDNWEPVDMGGSGDVSVEGGQMIINQGEMISGVVFKNVAELPLTHYEITLQAKRLQGVDFFCGLTFPIGDVKKCATFICGGWGGSVTGISSIDDLDAANNATGSYQRYEDDKWYSIRLRVTPDAAETGSTVSPRSRRSSTTISAISRPSGTSTLFSATSRGRSSSPP